MNLEEHALTLPNGEKLIDFDRAIDNILEPFKGVSGLGYCRKVGPDRWETRSKVYRYRSGTDSLQLMGEGETVEDNEEVTETEGGASLPDYSDPYWPIVGALVDSDSVTYPEGRALESTDSKIPYLRAVDGICSLLAAIRFWCRFTPDKEPVQQEGNPGVNIKASHLRDWVGRRHGFSSRAARRLKHRSLSPFSCAGCFVYVAYISLSDANKIREQVESWLPATKRRRGRPKGTGWDKAAQEIIKKLPSGLTVAEQAREIEEKLRSSGRFPSHFSNDPRERVAQIDKVEKFLDNPERSGNKSRN